MSARRSCSRSGASASPCTRCPSRGAAGWRRRRCCSFGSNPAISAVERYPDDGWPDAEIVAYFDGRFGDAPSAPIADGRRVLNSDGSRSRASPYLSSVRLRARELGLERPGIDYAMTEVVHCKSRSEAEGVAAASAACAAAHFAPLLAACGARLVVFLGAHAAAAAQRHLGLDPAVPLHGPLPVAGRSRWVVFLPHPNARGKKKSLAAHLSPAQVAELRQGLAQGAAQPEP